MARLTWNDPGENVFQTGLDQVVLYSVNGQAIAWNGVTKITEKIDGASSTPLYIDGVKFAESRLYGDYAASIEAFSAPMEFGQHDGTSFDVQGIGFGLQPIKPFHFSYRTLIGNEIEREELGYRIHVVFNAYATKSDIDHETLNSDVTLATLSWDITTVPSRIVGRRPTAHLILDSRFVPAGLMTYLEAHLYGGEGVIGQLTTMSDFLDLINSYTGSLFLSSFEPIF